MKKLNKFIILALPILFLGCQKTEKSNTLELTLLNDTIVSFPKGSNKDSINIIKYSLKNNSNQIYFINNLTEQQSLSKTGIYKNGTNLFVYNTKNVQSNYEVKRHIEENAEDCVHFMMEDFTINGSRLGYRHNLKYFGLNKRNNMFFIHPNETVFFEYSLNLNKPIDYDGVRSGFVNLNANEKYYCKLAIASDSSNYKYVLTRDILETIKQNNAKVYNGVIESKNKVPIKVLD